MRIRLILIMILSLSLGLGAAGEAQAQSLCDLASVTPDQGPAGTLVTVSGSGSIQFDSLAVTVLWDGTEVATLPPDAEGDYSGSFNVPSDATPGEHTVTVVVPPTQGPSVECPFTFTVTASVQQQAYAVAEITTLPSTGLILAVPVAGLALGVTGWFVIRRRTP